MFFRTFPFATSTLGALILVSGCGIDPMNHGVVPDFGEMGPPAYREQPSLYPPDVIMLPPPAQPAPETDTPAPAPTTPPPSQPTSPEESEYLSQLEEAILQRVNAERAKVGAKALAMESTRRAVARAHSKDMAVRNFFDHTNPDGKSPFDRMKAAGISYSAAGENIAYNTYPIDRAVDAVMQGWMNSSGHRQNIQNVTYGRTGIGVYRSPNGRIYFTQVFTN